MKNIKWLLLITLFIIFSIAGCVSPQNTSPLLEEGQIIEDKEKASLLVSVDEEDAVEVTSKQKTDTEDQKAESAKQEKSIDNKKASPIKKADTSVKVEPKGDSDKSLKTQLKCSLSITCHTILANRDALDPAKSELVPKSGLIFTKEQIVFETGESVFDVLVRELKQASVHLEFVNVPLLQSVYIEGINNIYELDCGPLSGWMYRVNGVFPSYGCSSYQLKSGDRIEWVYSCDLGADVGGKNTGLQGK